jgi:3-dehydroquinate synthase
MPAKKFRFGTSVVQYHFAAGFAELKNIADVKNTVLLIDEKVLAIYPKKFTGWKIIAIRSGEQFKTQATVDAIIVQLIELGINRSSTLVGVGGGVVTDITGYVASIYMRGIRFGFVPTTILSLVDASIGGKNGVDAGVYKNMVGTIRQPAFILHDMLFVNSLPQQEWQDGFAEIIKHASIKSASMFKELQANDLTYYQKKKAAFCQLVQQNALIKTKVVQQDEFEQGDRKLLNFGHTYGHAIETQYKLTHGQAVAIGMNVAAILSEKLTGFKYAIKLRSVIEQYGLPTTLAVEKEKVFSILQKDKKAGNGSVNFILLERIGKAKIEKIALQNLYKLID